MVYRILLRNGNFLCYRGGTYFPDRPWHQAYWDDRWDQAHPFDTIVDAIRAAQYWSPLSYQVVAWHD